MSSKAPFVNRHFRCDNCQQTVIYSTPNPMPHNFVVSCVKCDAPMYLQKAGIEPHDRRAPKQIDAEIEAFKSGTLPEVDRRAESPVV